MVIENFPYDSQTVQILLSAGDGVRLRRGRSIWSAHYMSQRRYGRDLVESGESAARIGHRARLQVVAFSSERFGYACIWHVSEVNGVANSFSISAKE